MIGLVVRTCVFGAAVYVQAPVCLHDSFYNVRMSCPAAGSTLS